LKIIFLIVHALVKSKIEKSGKESIEFISLLKELSEFFNISEHGSNLKNKIKRALIFLLLDQDFAKNHSKTIVSTAEKLVQNVLRQIKQSVQEACSDSEISKSGIFSSDLIFETSPSSQKLIPLIHLMNDLLPKCFGESCIPHIFLNI
jgi:hypothetical protein